MQNDNFEGTLRFPFAPKEEKIEAVKWKGEVFVILFALFKTKLKLLVSVRATNLKEKNMK